MTTKDGPASRGAVLFVSLWTMCRRPAFAHTLQVLLVVVWLAPSAAWADPAPLVPVPPGDDQIEVVKKGEAAPFTGQLFGNATALRWANYLQQCHFRLAADVEFQRKTDQAEVDYQKRLVAIEAEKYARVVADLEAKNRQLQVAQADPPFYRTVWFGVVVGAVAMGAAVGFSAWGLSAAR